MADSPEYASLSEGENQWIAAHVAYGRNFGLDPSNVPAISNFFDSSLAGIKSGEQSAEDANAVINIVAVLLGEHICATSNLGWAIVSDEFGTDLCVRSLETSWVFFPQSSVTKRWEASETNWVVPFLAWVKEQVSEAPP